MKTLRHLCAAVVLTLALVVSAAAGVISTGITPPPPPEPTLQTDGTIHTGVAESEPEADAVAEIALNLLQSVLSLF